MECWLTYNMQCRQRGRNLQIGCGARRKWERANDEVGLWGIWFDLAWLLWFVVGLEGVSIARRSGTPVRHIVDC